MNAKPKPVHVAPFHPSPNESVIRSAQRLPAPDENVLLCGLPPLSVWPLPQLSDHPTSVGYPPPEHVMALVTDATKGGGGGEGSGDRDDVGDLTGGVGGGKDGIAGLPAATDGGGNGGAGADEQMHRLELEHVPVLALLPK